MLSLFVRMRLFQKAAVGILLTFMGLMFLVVFIAYSRRSGSTGLDAAQIQKIRYNDSLNSK